MAPRLPLFLAKSGYRSRRLSDAARLLPVIGMLLLLLPALWSAPLGAGGGASTAQVGVYVFAIWAGMIGVAAILAPRLPKTDPAETTVDKDPR